MANRQQWGSGKGQYSLKRLLARWEASPLWLPCRPQKTSWTSVSFRYGRTSSTPDTTSLGIWGPPVDRLEAIHKLKRVPELGMDFVDTADSYGPDVSEQLIREVLYPYDGMLVATKGGLRRPSPGVWERDGRPEYLRQQAITSRDRLGLQQIGLWQLDDCT